MKKILTLAFGLLIAGSAFAEKARYDYSESSSIAGNTVIPLKNSEGKITGMMVDGGKNFGQFSQMTLKNFEEEGVGYYVVPAHNIKEVEKNVKFSIGYSVDCDSQVVTNLSTEQQTPLSDMNDFHQVSSNMACQLFKQTR